MQVAEYLYRNPNGLIDALLEAMDLEDDEGLAEALGVSVPIIIQLRYKKLPVSAPLLLHMLEVSDTGVRQLQNLIVARQSKYH